MLTGLDLPWNPSIQASGEGDLQWCWEQMEVLLGTERGVLAGRGSVWGLLRTFIIGSRGHTPAVLELPKDCA